MHHHKDIHTAIEEGSWFVLYAVNSPPGFRCDLGIKVAPYLTVILDGDRFKRLGKQGADIRETPDGDWIMRLTPYCRLTVSPA